MPKLMRQRGAQYRGGVRRFRWLILGIVGLVAVSGCSSASNSAELPPDKGSPASSSTTLETASDEVTDNSPSSGGEPQDQSEDSVPRGDPPKPYGQVSAFQEEILADDVVTFEEYERAAFAATDCMKAAGVDVRGPFLESEAYLLGYFLYLRGEIDKSKLYGWAIAAPTEEAAAAADVIRESCRAEYFHHVDALYRYLNQATVEEIDAYYEELVACLKRAGVDVGDGSRAVLDDLAPRHFNTGCG
jgi:hypothetical protein